MEPLQLRGSPDWEKIGQRRNRPAGHRRGPRIAGTAAQARGFDPNPPKERVMNARAIVMDDASRGTGRADAAFSGDFLDLVAEDCTLDLLDDPFPILKAQPDPVWAADPVRSRYAVKLMCTLLPVVEGRFDHNTNVHGSPLRRELTLAQVRPPTTTPNVLSTPRAVSDLRATRQPIDRLGRTCEIAALVVYLDSDESAYTTGAAHVIDGCCAHTRYKKYTI